MRIRLWLLIFGLLSLASHACTRDKSIDPENVIEFESYLNDHMESQHIAAASVLLFRGNAILYEKYAGFADIEKSILLSANHVFMLASVSKTIAAVALMQLAEQGRFALDDAISNHLNFEVKHPNSNTPITFRHLLTHTAGITDGDALNDQYYYGVDSPVDLEYFFRDYLLPAGKYYDAKANFAKFTPGKGYEYSNVGAALMGLLVTQISGMDFNDYCKQYLFQPLGMTRSFWHLSEVDTTTIVRPYEYKHRDYRPLQHYTFTDYPNGGLRSNAIDLFHFCSAMANGGEFNGTRILQSATIDKMLKTQIPDLDDGQGLTFYYASQADNLWGHEGGESGVSTAIAFNPINHMGVIILTNASDADLGDLVLSGYRLAGRL